MKIQRLNQFSNPLDMLLTLGYKDTANFLLLVKNDDLFVKVAFASVEQEFLNSLTYAIKDPGWESAMEKAKQMLAKGLTMGIANWEKECLAISHDNEAEYQCWLDSLVEEDWVDQLVEEKKKEEESSGKTSNSN